MHPSCRLIAHRGASYDAPENTLASIRLGWAQQADAAEIDIHLTRDGEVVALHDPTLKRTAGHDGWVDQLDLATIRTLDAGGWKAPVFRGEKVPLLAEVLAEIPAGKSLLIELKGTGSLVPALQRIVEAGPVPLPRIFLICFDYERLKAAKEALPACTALYLADGRSDAGRPCTLADLDVLIAQAHAAAFDGLDLGDSWPIDAAFADRVHRAGLKLYVWTVNDAGRARQLAAAGVDGLTTDRPGWLRENLT